MSIHPLLASIGFTQGKWGGAHCPETGATLYQDTVRALMAIGPQVIPLILAGGYWAHGERIDDEYDWVCSGIEGLGAWAVGSEYETTIHRVLRARLELSDEGNEACTT